MLSNQLHIAMRLENKGFCWYNDFRKSNKRNAELVYKSESTDGRLTFELSEHQKSLWRNEI